MADRYVVKESGTWGFFLFDTLEATLTIGYKGFMEANQDAKFLNDEYEKDHGLRR